jgi:uncharacterized membrane protein YqjE
MNASSNASLSQSIRDLIADVGLLMRQEFQLVRAELSEKFDQAQSGLLLLAIGLLIALCALFALVQALIFAVAAYMPLELACASVGIVLALIALAFVARGQSYLKARNLAPRRTMNTMRGQIQRG